MNKRSSFLLRNLSVIALIVIYLSLVIMHIINDGFILANQIGLIITMSPFILLGIALDFLLSRNTLLNGWMRIVTQLLPLGVFGMQILSTIFLYLGKGSYDIFNYLVWIFLSLPFFIVSFDKTSARQRVMRTLYGTGAVVVVYMYLLTQTRELTYGIGEMIYFLYYFLVLYIASGITKLPYLGTIIGLLNAVLLLYIRYFPITANAKSISWDYDIAFLMEVFVLGTLIICIVIRIVQELLTKKGS